MKKTALALVAAAALLQGCNSGEPVNLKFNFQPGEKYGYTTVTKQNMSAAGMSVTQEIRMGNTYEISAAEGTNKKITASFDQIMMQVGGNGIMITYDSKNPSKQDSALKFMGGIINKPFSMTVSDKGEVISVSGLSNIIQSLADSAGSGAGRSMKAQVGQMFNDTSVRAMMQQAFYIYPEKPVRPGDTWKKEMNITGVVGMKITSTFKLLSAANGVAHLQVNSTIKGMPPAEGPMKDLKMDGAQNGTMDVQLASGLVTESKIHQSIKGTISGMENRQVPIDVNTDITITGKKL